MMTLPFPRPFAAVVFDLDGTLVHSAPDIAAALNLLLAEHNQPAFAVDETHRFVGAGAHALVVDAFKARGRTLAPSEQQALTTRYLAIYSERGSPDTTLYPGATTAIAHLRAQNIPLAICTNKAEGLARGVLAQFDLTPHFGAVIGSDSGFGRKPEAGPLVEACRQLGVDPAAVLMVGDTSIDIRTARAVQCQAVAVRHGYSQVPVDTLNADVVLASVADVTTLVTPR